MTTLKRIIPALPALVAAFLLTLLPACATNAPQRSGPIENPHIVERVAPRDADVPARIARTAGGFDAPEIHADGVGALFLPFAYLFAYIGYFIGWCFYKAGEAIWEAITSPPMADSDCDDCEEDQCEGDE